MHDFDVPLSGGSLRRGHSIVGVAEYTPQIHAAAVAEFHVPQAQLAGFTQTFESCLVERIEAKDPGAPVPRLPGRDSGALQAPLDRVATAALASTFVRSEQTALLINAGVFALAFVLVLALRQPTNAVGRCSPSQMRICWAC